jgi:hypothetical protein
MKCNIRIDQNLFLEPIEEKEDLDWEAIDRNYIDPLTYMVSQNCNEKFKTSYLGKFFNPSFFDKKEKSVKSSFESGFFCHATLIVVYFSYDDVIVGNNPIYDFVSQFNEISDFNNLVFAMEVNYLDTDIQKFEKIRFFMDVNKHSDHRDWELSDMESFAELQKKVAKLEFPSWCETFRNKIYHYSYELHPVVLSENIDLNIYKDDMNGLFDIIEDCLTVFEMEQL